ncbi:hypothetical protein SETIT_3G180300v2 [Setaria italica]|uniref:Uncharacterized protein n=1 Tax=Setaria italica TaxID=4555 RepID=A0A368QG45_SETIT|nr:hypothetical protein SETIT_3G180300v2 [Setaria italica]
MHSACTGTVLKNNKSILSILNSASLVRASVGASKIAPGLMIEVLLPTFEYASGWLDHYDLHYNIAVVNTKSFPAVQEAHIDRLLQIGPHCKVVAAGRQFDRQIYDLYWDNS